MTLDIEKVFDSVNHLFLITALEKYGFKEDFIKWIQILIQNQESCVINRGTKTNYFILERGTRQGNPISACLFILVLKFPFLFIMQNENINNLNIFENTFLYTAYAEDTTFFLKDEKSVMELMKTFYRIQLNDAIPKAWKENLYKGDKNFHDLTFSGHHIIKKYQIYSLSKCNSKELSQ